MKILSAEAMAEISKDSIKKLVFSATKARITNDAAEEIAKLLEKKAKEIAVYAVKNAKRQKRNKVTKDDILAYIFKKGQKW